MMTMSFMAHLASLLGFGFLAFFFLRCRSQANLMRKVFSWREGGAHVDWPERILRQMCQLLGAEFVDRGGERKPGPVRVNLGLLKKMFLVNGIRRLEYSTTGTKILIRLTFFDSSVRVSENFSGMFAGLETTVE